MEKINKEASVYAHSVQKEELIQRFVDVRGRLVSLIQEISSEKLEPMYQIGSKKLLLGEYFQGLIEHDLHHKEQIEEFLEN